MRRFPTLRVVLSARRASRRRRYSEKALPFVTIDNDAIHLVGLRVFRRLRICKGLARRDDSHLSYSSFSRSAGEGGRGSGG